MHGTLDTVGLGLAVDVVPGLAHKLMFHLSLPTNLPHSPSSVIGHNPTPPFKLGRSLTDKKTCSCTQFSQTFLLAQHVLAVGSWWRLVAVVVGTLRPLASKHK